MLTSHPHRHPHRYRHYTHIAIDNDITLTSLSTTTLRSHRYTHNDAHIAILFQWKKIIRFFVQSLISMQCNKCAISETRVLSYESCHTRVVIQALSYIFFPYKAGVYKKIRLWSRDLNVIQLCLCVDFVPEMYHEQTFFSSLNNRRAWDFRGFGEVAWLFFWTR